MRGELRQLINCDMTQLAAKILVLEHELNTLRGLRLSPDLAIADAAIDRSHDVERRLTKLREAERRAAEVQQSSTQSASAA